MSEIDWDQIMIASEASLKLGKNKKYIYLLWKEGSNMLLENSVCKKGNMLLITKAGYEHLKPLVKKRKTSEISSYLRSLNKQKPDPLLLIPHGFHYT